MMKRVIGKINPSDKNVHIWGAGFSGLILGYYLKDQGFRVTIYERANKAGGKIHTKKNSSGLIEKGPNALFLNEDGLELLKELKLEPIPAAKKLKRLLLLNGKPKRPYQLGLFSKMGLNSHKKPPLITDGLTVAEFFKPLLGSENVQHILTPVLSGIYATPAENLHFRSVFEEAGEKAQFDSYWDFIKMMIKNQKAQPKLEVSGSVTFEGGMQTLINRLADILRNDIKYNYKESFKIKGNTVICTDALSAAELLKEALPEVSTELSRIKYQELSSTTVHLKRDIRSLQKSFGVLIPFDAGYNSIGVLNNKAIFPANNGNIFSYTFISRKNVTAEEIHQDLKLLQADFLVDDIEHMEIAHWEHGLPVYDLQRFLSVKKLHQISQKHENVAIFGNYVAGISLREMISAAKAFAKGPTEYKGLKL
jgi:protoporphyrinogen/coproporphyrinogen III oxidase